MTAADRAADLAARARKGLSANPSELRGLGDAWRVAESALLADIAASPRRAKRIVAAFERLARRSGESEAIGRAARLHGSAMSQAGRAADSVAPYREAVRRLSGAARDGARIGLALSLARLGRVRDAVKLCRAALADADQRGDGLLAAAARMNEAVALHEGGDPAAALSLYAAARDGFAAANQPRHAARATDALANALVLLDRFDDALPLYDDAAATLERIGLAREAAICRANRGALLVALDRLGDADAALEAAERALRDAGDAPDAALARLDRGEALLRAHAIPEALHLIRTAVRSSDGRVPPVEKTRGLLLLARAEIAAGNAAAARRILDRPLPLLTPRARAERTELQGRALASAGHWRAAQRTLERAAKHCDVATARSRCTAAAAWCATESGDADAGRCLAETAEKGVARLPVPGVRFAAAAARFAAEDRAGRSRAATAALGRSFSALEDLRAGLGPDAMRAALLCGSEAWFARAVRHTLDVRGAAAALALLERWRARALADLVGEGERAVAPPERIDILRSKLAVLERRLGGEGLPALLRSTTAAPTRRLVGAIAATERALRAATDRPAAAPPAPPVDLRAFARSLAPGVVVVSLFTDAVDGMAFVVRRGGVRLVRGLGREGEIAGVAEELSFRLGKFALGTEYVERHGRRLADETAAALTTLSDRTLAPIADALTSAVRVIFVPHGAWHRVPLAALPFGGDGATLADRVPVALAPSVAALCAPVRRATGPSIVVSVPDPFAPAIAVEGHQVAASIPGARLLEGDAATLSALATETRASGAAPDVLHVAAHGRFRDDAPSMSAVRLADGWLRACEFRDLRLDGTLVVLSGCDTGVARVEGVGEAMGLVRAALAAGAREVVTSLWRVGDSSTAELMSRLHAGRAAGLPTDAALAAAQKSLRMQGLHPWHWAGFSCWTTSPRPGG